MGEKCWDLEEVDQAGKKIQALMILRHCYTFMGKRHEYGHMSQERVRRALGKRNRK